MKHTLPALPYAYEALEPHFDQETMRIHHQRHHQAYIDNLNKALDGTDAALKPLEQILAKISEYSVAVRNNAGGHYNHSLFWLTLSPNPKTAPEGKLAQAINETFGSLDELKELIKKTGLGQFGSGWVWLFVKYNGSLGVAGTPNQDNPLMDVNLTNRGIPVMGIDVWEHAYYLKYQNKRADFMDAFWKVVDWDVISQNYEKALNSVGK